jgi:hypothetical protein
MFNVFRLHVVRREISFTLYDMILEVTNLHNEVGREDDIFKLTYLTA